MNLQESIRRILREETSLQSKLQNTIDTKIFYKNVVTESNISPTVRRRLPKFDETFIHYKNFFQDYSFKHFDYFWDLLMERVSESLYHDWFVNSVPENKWDESEQFIQDYLTEKYYEDTKKWWEKNK